MNWRINLYDTSTLPTAEMREAMFNAEVGDDIYQEDPTVSKLESEAALLMGKESALFMPSGTMGNLVGLMAQTQRGDEVILESESHIYYYETGGLAAVSGLVPRLVASNRGILDPDQVRAVIRKPNLHYPHTSLLSIENTHNRAGGTITPPQTMRDLRLIADEHGLKIHLDGARIFNASIAMQIPVTQFTCYADTVMFCLSKGLGAPVGSILAGSSKIIEHARRLRKMLGGGMRRSGFLAAAGLVALRTGMDQLGIDNANAHRLAEALMGLPIIHIDLETVQTNMVLIDVNPSGMTADEFTEKLAIKGIKVSARPPYGVRMVTHRGITCEDIDEIVKAVAEICSLPSFQSFQVR